MIHTLHIQGHGGGVIKRAQHTTYIFIWAVLAASLMQRARRFAFKIDQIRIALHYQYLALSVQGVDHSPQADTARKRVTDRYLSEARSAFIQAYHQATSTLAHDWQDAKGQDAALTLFSLEKAAYEVAYEAENRPTWLPVPLQGLHGLLSGLLPISKTARGEETS